jgi:hypothetical protein
MEIYFDGDFFTIVCSIPQGGQKRPILSFCSGFSDWWNLPAEAQQPSVVTFDDALQQR